MIEKLLIIQKTTQNIYLLKTIYMEGSVGRNLECIRCCLFGIFVKCKKVCKLETETEEMNEIVKVLYN